MERYFETPTLKTEIFWEVVMGINQQQSNQRADIYWVPAHENELCFISVGDMDTLNPKEPIIKTGVDKTYMYI